jgi:hypothetical protein
MHKHRPLDHWHLECSADAPAEGLILDNGSTRRALRRAIIRDAHILKDFESASAPAECNHTLLTSGVR